ncbi:MULTISPECIES: hypothetical protein [unclassified Streptomyces]|uniref:hypothetical protein n=1 Tax=unclassified Streptomyces TaxID=2593676 RepID=UPI00017F1061|nr:hypothetical protein [Streptomyces sp. SPB074]EDY43961.1 hypothetical protein SSBG_02151 [Streptomyces sp. SPB074]
MSTDDNAGYGRPEDLPDLPLEEHYAEIKKAQKRVAELERKTEEARAALRRAIHATFPENHNRRIQRGVLTKVIELSKYSRQTVMDIRDGKIPAEKSPRK